MAASGATTGSNTQAGNVVQKCGQLAFSLRHLVLTRERSELGCISGFPQPASGSAGKFSTSTWNVRRPVPRGKNEQEGSKSHVRTFFPLTAGLLCLFLTSGPRIELYLRECYRYGVCIAPSTLITKLDDPNPRKRPHPCVFNAMMLVARDMATRLTLEPVPDETGTRPATFVMPESTPPVDILLSRIQAQCIQSLADVDRLHDYIQASLLLTHWYITHGRVLEAQYTSAVVNRYEICLLFSLTTFSQVYLTVTGLSSIADCTRLITERCKRWPRAPFRPRMEQAVGTVAYLAGQKTEKSWPFASLYFGRYDLQTLLAL